MRALQPILVVSVSCQRRLGNEQGGMQQSTSLNSGKIHEYY